MLKKPVKGNMIYANFILRIGAESSLANKTVIPSLTASMLKTGTTTRSRKRH